MKEQLNFFDNLSSGMDPAEALRQATDSEAKGKRLDYLIHKVFEQDERGKELLEIWQDSLIMAPTAQEGMDKVSIGINEGMKRFIRGIILTIRRVERGER